MENELTVLDMHNSYLSYIIHILPVVMPNHLIQETGKTTTHYNMNNHLRNSCPGWDPELLTQVIK